MRKLIGKSFFVKGRFGIDSRFGISYLYPMSEDRPVTTDALKTLGTIIDDKQGRDAIHIAVEPAMAGEVLCAGMHVGRLPDGRYGASDSPVGIVDPFLTGNVGMVDENERFWLLVYPRTITSLRHVWSHPYFPESAESNAAEPVTPKAVSEKWMRAWAVAHVSADYYGGRDRVSDEEAYDFAIQAGEDHHIGPYEDARDHIGYEWWSHWETITGKSRPEDTDGMYFSCGC